MKINCIAIDDEPYALKIIEDYINRIPFLCLESTFNNALEPLEYLKENPVDIIFLDIQMSGLTGVQFLKVLNKKPMVIFTTAYDSYALQGFELDVVDYLLKPIEFERFLIAVEKANNRLNGKENKEILLAPSNTNTYFFVKTGFKVQKVVFSEIKYIEGQGDYLKIVTVKEKIMTLQTYKDLEAVLPKTKFIRVHKSYMVGIDHVKSIQKNRISIGEVIIPISETYKVAFNDFLKHQGLIG
jgi:DNA-binding LytR/AlgR family response regulator